MTEQLNHTWFIAAGYGLTWLSVAGYIFWIRKRESRVAALASMFDGSKDGAN